MTRSAVPILLLTILLAVSGCANLPASSSPQAIGTIDREPDSTEVAAPAPGREPDLLLRDFGQGKVAQGVVDGVKDLRRGLDQGAVQVK